MKLSRVPVALAAIAAVLVIATGAWAQGGQPTSTSPLAPPPNGVRKIEPAGGWHALVGATVHVSPGRTLDKTTVIVRDGRIVSVSDGPAPAGARVHDAAGLHIYAGFIEPYLEVDVPRPDIDAPGSHWNPRVTPQRSALDKGARGVDERTGQSLREMGFVAAAISPQGGTFRGSSAVVSLARPSGDISQAGVKVYRDGAYQAVSFETAAGGGRDERPDDVRWSRYPSSQMGAIALIRQTLSDAAWQQKLRRETVFNEPHNALDWLAAPQLAAVPDGVQGERVLHGWGGRLLFDVSDELEAVRAAKIGREFSRDIAILGSGREYSRLDAVIETGAPIVLPLAFPRAPDVGGIGAANAVELEDLMRWEQAPTNPRRVDAALRAAGGERAMDISLTTSKGRDGGRRGGRGGVQRGEIGSTVGGDGAAAGSDARSAFAGNLGKAIKHGLEPERALAMLTVNPAKLLGVESVLGTIETGKAASFIVADGPLFTDKPDAPRKGEAGYLRPGRIVSVWIDGEENVIRERPELDISGEYELEMTPALPPSAKVRFNIAATDRHDEPEVTIIKATRDDTGHEDTVEIKVRDFDRTGRGQSRFSFSFEHEPFGEKGVFVSSGMIERGADGAVVLHGDTVRTSGVRMNWTARRTGPASPKKPSLTGAWPITFEREGGGSPVLVFDRGNVLTLQPPPGMRGREDGKAPKVDNFQYDGRTIRYEFDQAQYGMPGVEGVVKVEATIDWSSRPPPARMSGTLLPPSGEKLNWTATRRDSNLFAGEWRVTQAGGQAMPEDGPESLIIRIGGSREKPTVKLTFANAGKSPVEIAGEDAAIRIGKLFFVHPLAKLGGEGQSSDELTITWGKAGPEGDTLVGLGKLPDGSVHPYQARRTKASLSEDGKEAAAIAAIPEKLPRPFGPYGMMEFPPQERVVITNVTIWTCKDGTADTVIENGAVVISEGKIQYAGPSASLPRLADGYVTIDGQGKFLAPGIIDCHSHTGISRGVNEGGQAVTAEVRIGDVTDPDNVSWYRQLAGGVTCVNNLHGSANAIGGQNQVNKIRWGCAKPDDMHFEGAIAGIKFALGENPKQSNWGDRNTTRYPQTRMGVETLIRDRFTAAKEYAAAMKSATPPRRDLELETLAEILEGKRLVHCHSYRQDEILMLCRVAQDFGFKIGTFQHILEGYKVADELAKWSGGGSAFSDWWAYKFEVVDAIPADGPLMFEQGVIVSYNSDSDEMARRMNVEAGKATKYGGKHGGVPIPPHEAYKFVTMNPAKQLRIDGRTGSVESGKDADLALWSGPPTSTMSRCEMTWVDGRRLFSLDQDRAHRDRIKADRQRLIQKVLAEGAGSRRGRGGGGDGEEPEDERWENDVEVASARVSGRRLMLMDAVAKAEDARREIYLNMLLRGLDPRWMGAGECGCGIMNGGGE